MVLREFELEVVSLLVPAGLLSRELLETAELVSIEHTGYGYFLTVKHPSFPQARRCCHQPLVTGHEGDLGVGFVVYLGGGQLMLECHALATPVPEDVRDRELVVWSE